MFAVHKIFLLAAALSLLFHTGTSLSCWYCVGTLKSDCANGVEEAMVKLDCGADSGATCLKYENVMNSQILFARMCSTNDAPCADYIDCTSCNTDLCNGVSNNQ